MIIQTPNSVNKSQYFEIWVSQFRNTGKVFSSYGLLIINGNFVNFQHKRVPQQWLFLCHLYFYFISASALASSEK